MRSEGGRFESYLVLQKSPEAQILHPSLDLEKAQVASPQFIFHLEAFAAQQKACTPCFFLPPPLHSTRAARHSI